MDIYDDLEELKKSIDDADESSGRLKRPIIIILSILMIALIVSFFAIGSPLRTIIFGQIRSDVPAGNVLRTHGLELIFEGDTLEKATRAWHDNPDVETTLCIHGERHGETYLLTHAYEPEIYEQSFTHVRHAPCDDETILLFHTHPYKRCIASEADINTLRNAQQRDPDIAMIIMCEEDRFSVYT